MKDYIFKREKDIKALERALSIPKIKVISGLRRAGKSFLLNPLFKDYLIDNRGCTEDEFETMNFSEQDAIDSQTTLKTYLENLRKRPTLKYIFLDEPQETGDDFAKTILRFHKMNPSYQIYITGSNSKTLSEDILSQFGDDGKAIRIEALSFSEIAEEIKDFTVEEYFEYGALPYILVQDTPDLEKEMLKDLKENAYFSDVKKRLKTSKQLQKLTEEDVEPIISDLLSNMNNPVNTEKLLARTIKGRFTKPQDRNIFSVDSKKILAEMVNAFFLYDYITPVNPQNDLNPTAWVTSNMKYYCYDLGLLGVLIDSDDLKGPVLENAVYLELRRRGLEIKPHIEYDGKGQETSNVDFSFEYAGKRVLMQVAYQINGKNKKREIDNLLEIKGDYEKIIVYENNILGVEEPGIKYIKIEKFLKNFIE